jgi:TonB family protein
MFLNSEILFVPLFRRKFIDCETLVINNLNHKRMKTKFILILGLFSFFLLCTITQLECYGISPYNNCSDEYYLDEDTTVYDGPMLESTAELPDAAAYFIKNNKYKDWDKNDKKRVVIKGIVEKDGTITNVSIASSSKVDKLDQEALRLIKSAKYIPGRAKGKIVRSKYTNFVFFPPEGK